MHKTFADSQQKAEALVLEALLWLGERGTVRRNDGSVSILFQLSSDPTYPFLRMDEITNEALDASRLALRGGDRAMDAAASQPGCASKAAKRALEARRVRWDGGEHGRGGMTESHNELGMALGRYLMAARRTLESSSLREAQEALGSEGSGVSIHPAAPAKKPPARRTH